MGHDLREAIPKLLVELGARTLLHIPCGDIGWLSEAEFEISSYIGADADAEIVAANAERYAAPRRRFEVLDVTRDALPQADVVLCRDGLALLPPADALRALQNIRASGCGYLLATTSRSMNLCHAPFSLPEPLRVIVESDDKALGLWSAGDLDRIG